MFSISNKKEVIVSVIFIVASLYLLLDRFVISKKGYFQENKWKGVSKINLILSPTVKINEFELKDHKTTFIFLIHNYDCPPCITEVLDYLDLINEKPFFQPVVLFVGVEIKEAIRTINIVNIEVPAFYGELNTFRELVGESRVFNQVLVFDNTGKLLERKYLPYNSISSTSSKIDFIQSYDTQIVKN